MILHRIRIALIRALGGIPAEGTPPQRINQISVWQMTLATWLSYQASHPDPEDPTRHDLKLIEVYRVAINALQKVILVEEDRPVG